MLLKKIRKIIVFGGGTSGWLTAAYLVNNLSIPVEVHLIEDASLGPIGVGEGTQPLTARFLYHCGIDPKQWMEPSNAAFKHGVELIGWNDTPYFVDNDTVDNTLIADNLFTFDYFIDKPYKEFAEWHPAYRIAKANKSPKYKDHYDVNFHMGNNSFGAVHFSAFDIIKTIKELILDKITYTDTRITNVEKNNAGIVSLSDFNNHYYADLYIDCSGFSSILLEKTLNVPFKSYNDLLLCDKAVALPTEYTNPADECHPYTKATAMNSGWRWTIPIYNRVGNGYVYSSKFISPEDAEKELRDSIKEYNAPVRHLDMKCGVHNEVAVKNVCAVGLSAGFIEPLEATGITFTTSVVTSLTNILNHSQNIWGNTQRTYINDNFKEVINETFVFVWAHYHFSTKNDTPFWQEIRKQKITDLSEDAQQILSHFYPTPMRFLNINQNSMFNVGQWFSVLHAGGAYKDTNSNITDDDIKYAEYFLESNTERINKAINLFPNHYDFLRRWYEH